jgi:uncharacterized membrane protein YGL010W
MKTVEQNLTQYAAYHRDRRNIATHFIGVPMIVFAVILALATVSFKVVSTSSSIEFTLAAVVAVITTAYYLRQDLTFGLAMAVVFFAMCAGASEITARTSTGGALSYAFFIFTVGWALQFLGHRYEGMKPAFFDDVMQLVIGPLFVCAEMFFALGAKPQLRRYIEERVGPIVDRRATANAPSDDSTATH